MYHSIEEKLKSMGSAEDEIYSVTTELKHIANRSSVLTETGTHIADPYPYIQLNSTTPCRLGILQKASDAYRKIKSEKARRELFSRMYQKFGKTLPSIEWRHFPVLADSEMAPEVQSIIFCDFRIPIEEPDGFSDVPLADLLKRREEDMKKSILDQLVENAVCTAADADANANADGQLNRLFAVFECTDVKCKTVLFGWDDMRDHRCSYLDKDRKKVLFLTSSPELQRDTTPSPSLLFKFVPQAMELLSGIPT